jgi:hypothetical protein
VGEGGGTHCRYTSVQLGDRTYPTSRHKVRNCAGESIQATQRQVPEPCGATRESQPRVSLWECAVFAEEGRHGDGPAGRRRT